jgi:hypothetical protein
MDTLLRQRIFPPHRFRRHDAVPGGQRRPLAGSSDPGVHLVLKAGGGGRGRLRPPGAEAVHKNSEREDGGPRRAVAPIVWPGGNSEGLRRVGASVTGRTVDVGEPFTAVLAIAGRGDMRTSAVSRPWDIHSNPATETEREKWGPARSVRCRRIPPVYDAPPLNRRVDSYLSPPKGRCGRAGP